MKINEQKAKKIIKAFNVKYPNLVVVLVYDCDEGTIVKAIKPDDEFKIGIPYYQVLTNGAVIHANPLGRPEFFNDVVKEENMIYRNSDVD